MKPWEYLEDRPGPHAPPIDNPSGLYCGACRAVGVWHCASPEYCGQMRHMADLAALCDQAEQKEP